MKAPSPLLGFNNNFKHKGSVYHIQTEDSGVKHPHIITHLFADGGRILKSIKTSYSTYVGEASMAEIVRTMMKDQHKAMIVALRDGRFDPGGSREVDLPSTGYFAGITTTSAGQTRGTTSGAHKAIVVPGGAVTPAAPLEIIGAPKAPSVVAPPPPPMPDLSVDVAALEKAAVAAAEHPHIFRPQSDLPPPPANVLGGGAARPHGNYSDVGQAQRRPASMRPPAANVKSSPPQAVDPATPPPRAAVAGRADSGRMSAVNNPSRPPTGRYAMTRPASIFATNKPTGQGSIFGEDLISERSLDEVILSYLAEDLEGEKK